MRIRTSAALAPLAAFLIAASPSAHLAAPGDADAVAFAFALDSGEIMMADLAMSKKLSSGVMEYVKDLKEDHQEHLRDLTAAATNANVTIGKSDLVDSLKKKTMDAHHRLMGATDGDFEKMFLDEMIKGHTDALETIEKKLLPSELSPGVKGEIEDLQKGVQEHLAKARTLKMG